MLLLVTGLVLCAESSPPPVPAPSPPLAPVHEVVVQQAFEAEPNVEMDSVVSATLRSRLALGLAIRQHVSSSTIELVQLYSHATPHATPHCTHRPYVGAPSN